jgi:hypothetical protein
MTDPWFAILRWTILGALVVGIISVPVVYHQRAISASYASGQLSGSTLCEAKHQAAAAVALQEAQAQMELEAAKALEAQKKAALAQARSTQLKAKLDEALKAQPEATSCILNDDATSVLRDFAADGSTQHRSGDSVSSPTAPEVSRSPRVS